MSPHKNAGEAQIPDLQKTVVQAKTIVKQKS